MGLLPGQRRGAGDADGGEALRAEGIVVRRVAGYGLPECLRITVGDEASCRRVAHIVGRFMADRAASGPAERTA